MRKNKLLSEQNCNFDFFILKVFFLLLLGYLVTKNKKEEKERKIKGKNAKNKSPKESPKSHQSRFSNQKTSHFETKSQ